MGSSLRRRSRSWRLFIVLPLVNVFVQAFSKGLRAYLVGDHSSRRARRHHLTLLVAAISVALNLVFGVIAAWAIAKFEFRGQEPVDHR